MPAASRDLVMLRSSRSHRLCGSGLLLNLLFMEPVLLHLRLLSTTDIKRLQFNSVLDPVFGRRQWLETLIHGVMIFAMVGGCANSMGVGLMQIGAGLESAFGISQSNLIYLLVAVFIGVMFVIMSVSGIHKGLKYVSTITFFIFCGLLIYVFICGDTAFIGKLSTESFGKILDNWGSKTLVNNTLSDDTWYANWIVQYWASFILYCPVFGMFFCRMAKGRTLREFLVVNVIIPAIFCVTWIGVFGGQTISLQTSGTMDVWAMVQDYGMQATVFQIIKSLPIGNIVQIVFIIAIIGSFTTMADPIASVLATMSVHNLTVDDEAPKKIQDHHGSVDHSYRLYNGCNRWRQCGKGHVCHTGCAHYDHSGNLYRILF